MWSIFHGLLVIWISSLKNCLFISSAQLLIGLFAFCLLKCVSSLYILDVNPLLDMSFTNIFSHTVGCLFVLLMVSFAVWSFIVWCGPIYSFLLLFPLPKEMCSDKKSLSLYIQEILPMFLLRGLWFHDLRSGLWSILSLLLCMELDNNPVSFSYI